MSIEIIPHWLKRGHVAFIDDPALSEIFEQFKKANTELLLCADIVPMKIGRAPIARHRKHRTLWLKAKAGM